MPSTYQWEKVSGTLRTAGSEQFTITNIFAQYNTASRKWFKDSTGRWGFVTPQGTLYHKGISSFAGQQYWNNPNSLVGTSALTIRNTINGDAGQYRVKASNAAGNTDSNPATLILSN